MNTFRNYGKRGPKPKPKVLVSGLTSRQWDFANAIARGLSRQEIAKELGVAFVTVRRYIDDINRAWGTHTKYEIMVKVHNIQLVEREERKRAEKPWGLEEG